jgi:membrane-bound lytic murein transglycosylase D
LIYIALIESGFSGTARSHANAVGYWQFIRGTGKRYGLQIDDFVDERRDFVLATRAAADYFKGLYNLFGAWYLAIASYNVGENRIKNLVMRYHTRDFWRLARENKLPRETIDYVPKFLAARLIAKNPERYGFSEVEYMPALEFREIELNQSADLRRLAAAMGVDYDDLRDLNPAYKRGVAVARRGGRIPLRVPPGQEAAALAALPQAAVNARSRLAASDEDYSYYRVRRGETLSSIARKFGVSQSALARLNGLSTSSRLVSGRRLRVPAEVMPARSRRSPQGRAVPRRGGGAPQVHVVRRGETLSAIASRYGVRPSTLAAKNKIRNRSTLHVGRRLTIPASRISN